MNTRTAKRLLAAASSWSVWVAWSALAAAAPAQTEDIRDIRPLISIPPGWYWLVAAGASTLLLALVFLAIRAWRRRSRRALTPQQEAERALERAEGLAREGKCREWAELVAQTLRSALAARLGRATCPETTNELAQLEWNEVAQGATIDAQRLIALLTTCDLTRFALGRLETSALLSETEQAREWLKQLFEIPEAKPANAVEATS